MHSVIALKWVEMKGEKSMEEFKIKRTKYLIALQFETFIINIIKIK